MLGNISSQRLKLIHRVRVKISLNRRESLHTCTKRDQNRPVLATISLTSPSHRKLLKQNECVGAELCLETS